MASALKFAEIQVLPPGIHGISPKPQNHQSAQQKITHLPPLACSSGMNTCCGEILRLFGRKVAGSQEGQANMPAYGIAAAAIPLSLIAAGFTGGMTTPGAGAEWIVFWLSIVILGGIAYMAAISC